jgi:4-hydroxy-tetrahydrodipicolinate synthase
MQNAWMKGDIAEMARARDLLAPVHKALFCETSPAPVKYAAMRLGFGSDELRLPLVPASATARKMVDDAMAFAGLMADANDRKHVA